MLVQAPVKASKHRRSRTDVEKDKVVPIASSAGLERFWKVAREAIREPVDVNDKVDLEYGVETVARTKKATQW